MKARVYLETVASQVVDVEIPDTELEGLEEDEISEKFVQLAYEEMSHGLCAQCTGWRQNWGIDLGEWELIDDDDAVEILKG